MAYELRDNSGSLFRNEKKLSETHPDHTGQCMIDGTKYQVSAWIKQTKDGRKYFSLSFRTREEEKPKQSEPEFDDDVPW
jgi:uncharacterized protein (DUF736 family)